MNKNLFWLVVLIAALLLSSCFNDENTTMNKQVDHQIEVEQSIVLNTEDEAEQWQQVTVIFNDFEGGFFGLVSLTGDSLLPLNLPKEYRKPGTKLKVKGTKIEDMMTTVQWGTVFKITEFELVSLGNEPSDEGIVE